jgi:hypothetical protein
MHAAAYYARKAHAEDSSYRPIDIQIMMGWEQVVGHLGHTRPMQPTRPLSRSRKTVRNGRNARSGSRSRICFSAKILLAVHYSSKALGSSSPLLYCLLFLWQEICANQAKTLYRNCMVYLSKFSHEHFQKKVLWSKKGLLCKSG